MLQLTSSAVLSLAPPASLPLPLAMLAGTNLGGKQLARCYKASCDGWSALDFHRQCDELGSIMLVGKLESGEYVGGYNPIGWESIDDYRATPRAFIVCAEATADEAEPSWLQCAALGPGEVAIFDNARGGPQFGAADLVIGEPLAPVKRGFAGPDTTDDTRTAGDLRVVRARLGGSYAKLPGSAPFPTGELVEMEAYCNANLADRGDAWNPSRASRVSKAPELTVSVGGANPAAEDSNDETPQIGWWPF